MQYIHEFKLIQPEDRLLIAVSGGMDSMALLHLLHKFRGQLEIEVLAVHVDHMLRGEQSAGDRQFVERFCKERQIKIFSEAIPIPAILSEEAGNLQAVCRRERYQYFQNVMDYEGIYKLVTAHHADDQLESVLMALTKGAIIKGIQGIRAIRPFFNDRFVIRPFLAVTKQEIRQYLVEQGVCYREDASNQKDDYLRNRMRHHIIPLLKEEHANVAEHAVHFTKHLQEDAAYLMEQAEELFPKVVYKESENSFHIEIPALQKVPVALQKRIILILLNYLYKNSNTTQSYALWTSILKLCEISDGSSEIHLPEGFKAVRVYDQLKILKQEAIHETITGRELLLGQWCDINGHIRLYIGPCTDSCNQGCEENIRVYYFNSMELISPYFIRSRQNSDRIALKGMSETKRLSRLFIDEKIPLHMRDRIPILVSKNNEVLAALGVRMSKYFSKEKRINDDMMLIFTYASV